eukprot:1369362-Rhodomonas_salina.1
MSGMLLRVCYGMSGTDAGMLLRVPGAAMRCTTPTPAALSSMRRRPYPPPPVLRAARCGNPQADAAGAACDGTKRVGSSEFNECVDACGEPLVDACGAP